MEVYVWYDLGGTGACNICQERDLRRENGDSGSVDMMGRTRNQAKEMTG